MTTNNERSLPKQVQDEVARLRNMIAETKALLPGGNVNWAAYEFAIAAAEKAVREQDAATLARLLPELRSME